MNKFICLEHKGDVQESLFCCLEKIFMAQSFQTTCPVVYKLVFEVVGMNETVIQQCP